MHTLLTRSVCRNFIDPSFNSLLINVPWPWSASLSHLFIKFIKNICGNSECASLARDRLWELQPDLTALKSHSFSINRQLIQKIGAHITVQCDFWSVRILYCFSHRCVFYGGKFRILSTFDSSKNDAIKSKKIIIMRCFTLNITICASACVCEWAQLLTVPHLFAAETIYHHVSVNNCTSKPTKNGSNERASTEQSANWRIFHSILLLQVSLFECASYKNDSPHTFISFTSPKREKYSCCMRIELRILFAFRIKISSLFRYFVYSFIYLVSFFASGKKKN